MDKCLYFLITLNSNGPIEISNCKCILSEENIYKTNHIFVFKAEKKKLENNKYRGEDKKFYFKLEFIDKENKYIVSFKCGNIFIFNVILEKINEKEEKPIDINQNDLEYSEKL